VNVAPDSLFEFLLGEWRIEGAPRVSALVARFHGVPRYTGRWRASRAGGAIVDVLRLTDGQGVERVHTRYERRLSPTTGKWVTRETNRLGETTVSSTITVQGRDVILLTPGGTEAGLRIRARFIEISATRFRYVRERSTDGGRTWEEPTLTLSAHRER
jgi:hypothetical protein